MKQILLLFTALLISKSCLAGKYSDCILENMKGIGDKMAARQIAVACREKALPYVPAKCSDLKTKAKTQFYEDRKNKPSSNYFDRFNEFNPENEALVKQVNTCITDCLNASYWSKHFGDCKE